MPLVFWCRFGLIVFSRFFFCLTWRCVLICLTPGVCLRSLWSFRDSPFRWEGGVVAYRVLSAGGGLRTHLTEVCGRTSYRPTLPGAIQIVHVGNEVVV